MSSKEVHTKGFPKGKADEVVIKYSSCIDGKGKKEIDYLMDLHTAYFKYTDIQFEANKKAKSITAESHSLYDLMKGERGIHLFYRTHQTPLPIKIEVTLTNHKEEYTNMNVIRLYDLKATLSDLRSGFSNDVNILPKEFKLLLFAGLEQQLRSNLMIG